MRSKFSSVHSAVVAKRPSNTSVVKGTIEVAVRIHSLGDHGFDLCRHRDVGVDKAGGAAGIVNHFDGALGAFLQIVSDHHARAFLCEFERGGPANTRPTAGHQHDFVLNKP